MDVMGLLDYLREEIEAAGKIPFTNNCMIDREKVLDLVEDIRSNLPRELMEAEEIRAQRSQIIEEAEREAEGIRSDASQRADQLIEENEITQEAYDRARQILEQAQHAAEETRLSANEYVEDILADMETYITHQLNIVRTNREQMQGR